MLARLQQVVLFSLVGTALSGCAWHGFPVAPSALGCYDVRVEGWSEAAARVTGFRALPLAIAIDTFPGTDRGCRARAPRGWRFADAPNENRLACGHGSPPWRRLADSVLFDPEDERPHRLGNDSLLVTFDGWGGRLVAFLEPTPTGYRGIAQLEPRPLAQGVGTIHVELVRRSCAGLEVASQAGEHDHRDSSQRFVDAINSGDPNGVSLGTCAALPQLLDRRAVSA